MITMQSDVSSENYFPGSSNHESTYMETRSEYLPQQSTTQPMPTVGACNVVSVTPLLGHSTLSLF